MIHIKFLEDISNYIGSMRIPRDLIHEARGYPDMSFDEIEETIKEKYTVKT
ncbi:MAG: hypothetical protein K2J73_00875 [Oscillospiraceae bacterium]|nr:hypothetical protein [Oscillospiraceae bacterium]